MGAAACTSTFGSPVWSSEMGVSTALRRDDGGPENSVTVNDAGASASAVPVDCEDWPVRDRSTDPITGELGKVNGDIANSSSKSKSGRKYGGSMKACGQERKGGRTGKQI